MRDHALAGEIGEGSDPDRRCRHAAHLDRLGRTDQAKAIFLAILADYPCHSDTLNRLGALLQRTGYSSAARTVFTQAVGCHPNLPDGHVNLGNALRAAGELEAARAAFLAALKAAPAHTQAHQGLGDLLAETGDTAGAAHHWRLGYTGHAVHRWTYRGQHPPVRVLMPVSAANGNIAARVILDDRVFDVTTLTMEFLAPGEALPPHDVVLNAIGDADLCAPALSAAAHLARRTMAPVINDPVCVLKTGRVAMLAALSGIEGVVVPRAASVPREALLGGGGAVLEMKGLACPMLLRAPGFHTGRHFMRVSRVADLADAAAGLPGPELLVIAYLDAASDDGMFRKGRVMVIDGRLYPLHWAVGAAWKVHYFTSSMAQDPQFRAEEARFLANMAGFLGAQAVSGLLAVAKTLNLDYGGIDFGLLRDGRPVVFEANATMALVEPPRDPLWAYRRPAYEAAVLAARSLLIRRARNGP